jgi:hypothetical protein
MSKFQCKECSEKCIIENLFNSMGEPITCPYGYEEGDGDWEIIEVHDPNSKDINKRLQEIKELIEQGIPIKYNLHPKITALLKIIEDLEGEL